MVIGILIALQINNWNTELGDKRDEQNIIKYINLEFKQSKKTLDEINQTLVLPYLTKHASLKNIDSYSIVKWKEKSKLPTNYYTMFHDFEFENNIENQVWDITNYIAHLEQLENATIKVIEETNNSM